VPRRALAFLLQMRTRGGKPAALIGDIDGPLPPQANLVVGMRSFAPGISALALSRKTSAQTTWTRRYNTRHCFNGHRFRGRYRRNRAKARAGFTPHPPHELLPSHPVGCRPPYRHRGRFLASSGAPKGFATGARGSSRSRAGSARGAASRADLARTAGQPPALLRTSAICLERLRRCAAWWQTPKEVK